MDAVKQELKEILQGHLKQNLENDSELTKRDLCILTAGDFFEGKMLDSEERSEIISYVEDLIENCAGDFEDE